MMRASSADERLLMCMMTAVTENKQMSPRRMHDILGGAEKYCNMLILMPLSVSYSFLIARARLFPTGNLVKLEY